MHDDVVPSLGQSSELPVPTFCYSFSPLYKISELLVNVALYQSIPDRWVERRCVLNLAMAPNSALHSNFNVDYVISYRFADTSTLRWTSTLQL